MRLLIFILLLCSVCNAQDLLDRPIEGRTGAELITGLGAVYKALPPRDATAFAQGVAGLTVEFRLWRREPVSDEEHDRFLLSVVRGMTPRQIIVLGSMLRSVLMRKEYAEDRAIRGRDDAGKEGVAVMYEKMATEYLARYEKKG